MHSSDIGDDQDHAIGLIWGSQTWGDHNWIASQDNSTVAQAASTDEAASPEHEN